jgi:hypothetical protein
VTARTMPELGPLEAICCAAGCGKLGAYQVGAKVWADTDPLKQRGSLDLETTMVACEEHRHAMPTTAAEFFTPEGRQRITHAMRATRRPPPDFERAEWHFTPIPTPDQKGAH